MNTEPTKPAQEEEEDSRVRQIVDLGSSVVTNDHGTVHCLTVIGQIEGHGQAPSGTKTTKYEHVLPLLASIEEEEGSEASAMEINEITQLVKEHQLPVIFTEVNGSDATANAISRETGCQVAQLTMLMDGPEEGDLSTYLEGVRSNVNTIVSFFGGEELDQL